MTKLNFRNAEFLLSVAQMTQLPPDTGIEVAIIGRSNAGKSSVLNQITQNKNLARVSKTPGRTQLINIFRLDSTRRLVDLPGYGYAKVPPAMKQKWQQLLDTYLRTRESLKGLILVMDSRHPLKEFDQHMLQWCNECNLPVHILLNKVDKLSNNESKQAERFTEEHIATYSNPITFQLFSALRGTGVVELKELLNKWFKEH